jgi:thioredoxin-related protein
MKLMFSTLVGMFLMVQPQWLTDFSKAKNLAQEQHKMILLNFSGSDWCGPCIRMHKEIFEDSSFDQFAAESLVLVKADFPRLKKNQLPAELTKSNEALAAEYNPEGVFPLTVLLDETGKVVKRWEGYPGVSAEKYIADLNSLVHVAR